MEKELDITQISITRENPFRLCFVCLGNICRSPTGEGVFRHLVNERGYQPYFFIDSAGTSAWHTGEPANHNSRNIAEKYGVDLLSKARKFEPTDLDEFDLILAMDRQNYRDILSMASTDQQRARVRTMRSFDPDPEDGNVPDPYQGGLRGFENVYQIVYRSCNQLLDLLEPRIQRS